MYYAVFELDNLVLKIYDYVQPLYKFEIIFILFPSLGQEKRVTRAWAFRETISVLQS